MGTKKKTLPRQSEVDGEMSLKVDEFQRFDHFKDAMLGRI